MSSRKLRVLSLFSGCGGLDIPFSKDRYQIACAIDNDPSAIRCLKANLDCNAAVVDVTSDAFEQIIQGCGPVDIVLGGFPCQGFSKSGSKKADDPRNKLYTAMLRAVEVCRPSLFLAENVDGMAQNFNGTFVDRICTDFSEIGYSVKSRILNAVNYGVPQFRRRIFFVGTGRNGAGDFEWPAPTHYGESRNGEFKTAWEVGNQPDLFQPVPLLPPPSISDAISDLLGMEKKVADQQLPDKVSERDRHVMAHIKEGQKLCNVRFSETSVYTWDIPEVFGETTKREKEILITIGKNRRKRQYGDVPNGNPLSQEVISELSGLQIAERELDNLVSKGFLKKIDERYDLKGAMFCSGLYKRPKWNSPSPTVLTVFNNPRYFFHPLEERPFTIRECARLQSFPDNFRFLDTGISSEDAYRLIGNAVPPKLSNALQGSIWKYFSTLRIENADKIATLEY